MKNPNDNIKNAQMNIRHFLLFVFHSHLSTICSRCCCCCFVILFPFNSFHWVRIAIFDHWFASILCDLIHKDFNQTKPKHNNDLKRIFINNINSYQLDILSIIRILSSGFVALNRASLVITKKMKATQTYHTQCYGCIPKLIFWLC